MSEPKYELRFHDVNTSAMVISTHDTWDDAAEQARRSGWGHWETPAEFKLQDGVTIKAVR